MDVSPLSKIEKIFARNGVYELKAIGDKFAVKGPSGAYYAIQGCYDSRKHDLETRERDNGLVVIPLDPNIVPGTRVVGKLIDGRGVYVDSAGDKPLFWVTQDIVAVQAK